MTVDSHRAPDAKPPARWLVRLLIFALVPAVMIAGPGATGAQAAAAAAAFDDVGLWTEQNWEVEGRSLRPYDEGTCNLNARWTLVGTSPNEVAGVEGRLNCDTEWNVAYHEVQAWFSGTNAEAATCEVMLPFTDPENDTPTSVFSSIQTESVSDDASTCHLTSMCWDVYTDGVAQSNSANLWATGCEDMDLGPMSGGAPSGECVNGTARRPVVGPIIRQAGGFLGSDARRQYGVMVTFRVTATQGTPNWRVYGVVDVNDGYSFTGQWDEGGGNKTQRYGAAADWPLAPYQIAEEPTQAITPAVGVEVERTWWVPLSHRWHAGVEGENAVTAPHGSLAGAGVVGKFSGAGTGIVEMDLYPTQVTGMYGVTDPSRCGFYWGDKIVTIPDTAIDDPIGDLPNDGEEPPGGNETDEPPNTTPPPPDAEDGCDGFSITDPTTWAGAGICAIVKALAKVIDVLEKLVTAIAGLVEAIGELLLWLLVPSDGFLESKVTQVKDAWSDAAPIAFLSGIGDVGDALIIGNPGGACIGPTLTFTEPVGNQAVSVNPMSTCGASMSVLAGVVKAALTVLVYVGGFLVAARIIAASFGLALAVPGTKGDPE